MYQQKPEISLQFLFTQFLIIGSTSFGGFMALISIVEKQLVERRKLFTNEELLDVVSVATILPGPMAVNVVTALGYKLRGMKGAMVSMAGILIPTFLLILMLSWLYFEYGNLPEVDSIFGGVLPAVCAIIVAVAFNMAKKNLKDYRLILICLIAAVTLLAVGGFFITIALMGFGGIFGYIFYRNTYNKPKNTPRKMRGIAHQVSYLFRENIVFLTSILGVSLFFIVSFLFIKNDFFLMLRSLFLTFGSVSVTLFGGGYVFIPILQELIVEQLHWVTEKEFVDGIALGQITPGPIMISAAFIGYKQAGIFGALISTVAIFLPPGLLMILVSSFVDSIKKSAVLNAALKGVRATVIGMIFAAAWIIGRGFILEWIPMIIFVIVFILTYRLKISVIYLIPFSGLIGYFFIGAN